MLKKGCKPVVLITTGDPAGIGPEIVVKVLKDERIHEKAKFFVIGDEAIYRVLGSLEINPVRDLNNYKEGFLNLISVSNIKNIKPGVPTKETAISAYMSLEKAVGLIKQGIAKAVITGPVYKKGIISAGIKFIGHTEFFQERFNISDVLMSFYSDKLFVGTATTHLPISKVSKAIKKNALRNKIFIALTFLKKFFGLSRPSIAVLGLNPHAGEGGSFGEEELNTILPICHEFRQNGENVVGPIPADVAFFYALKGDYDFVFGMYHDQVLAPFKMLFFESGVNVTMGLPFIRTSPDHGTAFDIAGTGKANCMSMVKSVKLALKMLRFVKRSKDEN